MVKYIVFGAIAFVALIVIFVLLAIFLPADWLLHLSQLSVVFVSAFLCLLVAVMVALTAVLAGLFFVIQSLLKKVDPLLDKVNETADTAKGTVAYVGEGVVSPLVKVAMILAAIRGAIGALFKGRA